jgi:hypothetical protein
MLFIKPSLKLPTPCPPPYFQSTTSTFLTPTRNFLPNLILKIL